MIGSCTAIAPWAMHASRVFSTSLLIIDPQKKIVSVSGCDNATADYAGTVTMTLRKFGCRSQNGCSGIDEVIILLADQLFVPFARRNGRIESCVQKRLEITKGDSTLIGLSGHRNCAGPKLITQGATTWAQSEGRFNAGKETEMKTFQNQTAHRKVSTDFVTPSELRDNQWLVHCTRAPAGPWPDETDSQYKRSILLNPEKLMQRTPLDALIRILRSGQLIAQARVSNRKFPVVSFSSMPLTELLRRRRYRPHLRRWDYEPYGIAISQSAAKLIGIRPVIYRFAKDASALPESQRYRLHPPGKTYDWSQEQEWRSPQTVNLNQIALKHLWVFAPDLPEIRAQIERSSNLTPQALFCFLQPAN